MRDLEFQAREKKVQKMSRDGLVEQNRATGEEQRISGRLADVSFGKERTADTALGRSAKARASQSSGRASPGRGKPSRELVEKLENPVETAENAPEELDRQEEPEEPEGSASRSPEQLKQEGKPRAARPKEVSGKGRLRFEKDEDSREIPETRSKSRARQPVKKEGAAGSEGKTRLQFEPEERAQNGETGETEEAGAAQKETPREKKRYEKAQQRVEKSGRKLEKAQAKLPTRRRITLEKRYDSEAGRTRRRLQFEAEVIPEYESPSLPKRAGKAAGRTVKNAAVLKAHMKMREVERDNVAVEAAHKGEFLAERGDGRFLRWNRQRLHTKPYREVRSAERRLAKDQANLAWQASLRENPELRSKSALSKWMQKQKLKRKYAQAAREAQKTAQHTRNVLSATGQIIRAAAQFAAAHKTVLLVAVLLAVVILFFSAGLSSCTAMLSGVQSSYIASCYLADEADINDSDLYYSELETDLQKDINDTEENFPGYDEYRYHIGEIGHNPYELMGYLSAAFDAFTVEQVQAELDRLFGEQYVLTREEVVETRYDEDGDPYDWYVLETTLTVRPFSEIIAGSLPSGEQSDRYGIYMQTYGNRQAFGNPFSFSWLGYVSSPYGYRIHPISGEEDLHRGVDIAVAEGTPIQAVQDGRVVSAGNDGDYGLCVVIEDEKGYQSRYAHCSSISVTAGQEVKRGDVIAAVGNTGNSTGAHLHLEVKLNGEYLNPYYFVDNGDDGGGAAPGTAGGPVIPDDPGTPMGDGSLEAMLAEAEAYLGFPYVWGGSSPETSFDCSGYVSWVINHSGVGSVGRQTASGLFNLCTPVSRENARPGDLIFFTGTYSAPTPVSHVGILVDEHTMIHCGDPIGYANIDSSYWTSHYYACGRLP